MSNPSIETWAYPEAVLHLDGPVRFLSGRSQRRPDRIRPNHFSSASRPSAKDDRNITSVHTHTKKISRCAEKSGTFLALAAPQDLARGILKTQSEAEGRLGKVQ